MEIDDANDATGGGETHDGGGANDAEKPATAGIAEGTAEAGVDSGPRAPTAPWTESASPTAAKASGSGTAKASSGDASAAADNAAETPPNRAVSSTEASTAVNVNVNAPKAEPPAESGRVTASSAANGSPKPTAAVTTATPASKPKPSSVLSGGSSSKQAKSAAASSNAKPVKAKSSSSSSSSPSKSTTKNGSSSNNNTNNNDAISKTTATNSATTSLKKGARKKRKATGAEEAEEKGVDKGAVLAKKKKPKRKKEKDESDKTAVKVDKSKKARKQTKKASSSSSGNSGSSSHPYADHLHALPGLTADQIREQEQMRKALEEEQYSANGSIVDTDSDDDEHEYMYKGQLVRLDRVYLRQASKKCGWLGDAVAAATGISGIDDHGDATHDGYEEEVILREDGTTNNGSSSSSSSSKKKSSRIKKKGRNQYTNRNNNSGSSSHKCFRIDDNHEGSNPLNGSALDAKGGPDAERDEGSIFGQTTGASNSTWVECDKCKKWRRLRGVVDQSKLPKKWYCSMNRNDPERARCSAPEEEYDAPITPESAADARTRKHLRVWVRRLQGNEQYESRLPTLTRNKKRSVASTSKEPHEWVRCCNPSCGKWRAILRIMDAKQNVIDRTSDGEWYCVMNTWDEKTASCAAPQENLPAVGCPPWVLQDVAN